MKDDIQKTSDRVSRYWFPAKSYGWGWGLPCTWEGWLTFIVFIVICCSSGYLAGGSATISMAIIFAAACALVAIAWWKGEPPRWRWGQDS